MNSRRKIILILLLRQRMRARIDVDSTLRSDSLTSFKYFIRTMNDASCQKYFRLNLSIFNELAETFEDWSSSTMMVSHEFGMTRKRKLSHREIFGLGLRQVIEKPRISSLQVETGLGEATISRYLAFSLKGMLTVLKNHVDARIFIPRDAQYLDELCQRTENYCTERGYFPISGVVAVLDGYFTKGTNVTAKTFGGHSNRSAYDPFYSGYTGTGFKHLFLWGIDGAIWATVVIAEGSHHDSYLWHRMREVVERVWIDSRYC